VILDIGSNCRWHLSRCHPRNRPLACQNLLARSAECPHAGDESLSAFPQLLGYRSLAGGRGGGPLDPPHNVLETLDRRVV
jgi:hypothetical protein